MLRSLSIFQNTGNNKLSDLNIPWTFIVYLWLHNFFVFMKAWIFMQMVYHLLKWLHNHNMCFLDSEILIHFGLLSKVSLVGIIFKDHWIWVVFLFFFSFFGSKKKWNSRASGLSESCFIFGFLKVTFGEYLYNIHMVLSLWEIWTQIFLLFPEASCSDYLRFHKLDYI